MGRQQRRTSTATWRCWRAELTRGEIRSECRLLLPWSASWSILRMVGSIGPGVCLSRGGRTAAHPKASATPIRDRGRWCAHSARRTSSCPGAVIVGPCLNPFAGDDHQPKRSTCSAPRRRCCSSRSCYTVGSTRASTSTAGPPPLSLVAESAAFMPGAQWSATGEPLATAQEKLESRLPGLNPARVALVGTAAKLYDIRRRGPRGCGLHARPDKQLPPLGARTTSQRYGLAGGLAPWLLSRARRGAAPRVHHAARREALARRGGMYSARVRGRGGRALRDAPRKDARLGDQGASRSPAATPRARGVDHECVM